MKKALLFLTVLLGGAMVCLAVGTCKYCGSSSYGSCTLSPHKVHEHINSPGACVYCGSTSYGSCGIAPNKVHKHGSADNKCVYCGSSSFGSCSI